MWETRGSQRDPGQPWLWRWLSFECLTIQRRQRLGKVPLILFPGPEKLEGHRGNEGIVTWLSQSTVGRRRYRPSCLVWVIFVLVDWSGRWCGGKRACLGFRKTKCVALRGHFLSPGRVAQWIGALSLHQKVVALIPHQGTYLGFRCRLWLNAEVTSLRLTSMFLPSLLKSIKTYPQGRIF